MWWSRPVALLIVAATLAGCGFRPLHSGHSGGEPMPALTAIYIQPIADRLGQQLRNQLLDRLTPRGQPARPLYRLAISANTSTQELAVQKSEIATRANLHMNASFSLHGEKGEVVFEGRSTAITSFNILDSDYATLIAEKDATTRAVQVVAADIETRLALYFQRQQAQPAPAAR